jgi:hypothetical protein
MKKFFMAAGLLAVASINSFGAACVDGSMASQPGFGGSGNTPCQVTNGSYSWDISNFFLPPNGTASSGYGAVPTYADIFVSYATVGSNGFSLTYTMPNAPFFVWQNQDVQWTNGVWVTANNQESNVVSISLSATFPGSSNGLLNNAYVGISKEIQDQQSTKIHDSISIIASNGVGGTAQTITVSTSTPFSASNLSVNDRINFDARTETINNVLRSGSITSYSNTFYAAEPPSEVPEPMTFVLMGAGLVGIAALRRRKA